MHKQPTRKARQSAQHTKNKERHRSLRGRPKMFTVLRPPRPSWNTSFFRKRRIKLDTPCFSQFHRCRGGVFFSRTGRVFFSSTSREPSPRAPGSSRGSPAAGPAPLRVRRGLGRGSPCLTANFTLFHDNQSRTPHHAPSKRKSPWKEPYSQAPAPFLGPRAAALTPWCPERAQRRDGHREGFVLGTLTKYQSMEMQSIYPKSFTLPSGDTM